MTPSLPPGPPAPHPRCLPFLRASIHPPTNHHPRRERERDLEAKSERATRRGHFCFPSCGASAEAPIFCTGVRNSPRNPATSPPQAEPTCVRALPFFIGFPLLLAPNERTSVRSRLPSLHPGRAFSPRAREARATTLHKVALPPTHACALPLPPPSLLSCRGDDASSSRASTARARAHETGASALPPCPPPNPLLLLLLWTLSPPPPVGEARSILRETRTPSLGSYKQAEEPNKKGGDETRGGRQRLAGLLAAAAALLFFLLRPR